MNHIPVGTRGEHELVVTHDFAIGFLGRYDARVLSTPHMIGFMEWTSRNAVKPLLEEGYDTVGTVVNVKHLAATPIGMKVRFTAEVTAVEDRRVTFHVEAWDDKEKVGEGSHERFIIHVGRFAERLLAKKGEG